MPPQSIDPGTLEDLKRQAIGRAEAVGHHLRPFRAAKQDPLCYVSFCHDCRQMVIVSLADARGSQPGAGVLYGYALEARCTSHATEEAALVSANAR